MTSNTRNAFLTLATVATALGLVSCNHDRLGRGVSVGNSDHGKVAAPDHHSGLAVTPPSGDLMLAPDPSDPKID